MALSVDIRPDSARFAWRLLCFEACGAITLDDHTPTIFGIF
jgi:hypothetical protein